MPLSGSTSEKEIRRHVLAVKVAKRGLKNRMGGKPEAGIKGGEYEDGVDYFYLWNAKCAGLGARKQNLNLDAPRKMMWVNWKRVLRQPKPK